MIKLLFVFLVLMSMVLPFDAANAQGDVRTTPNPDAEKPVSYYTASFQVFKDRVKAKAAALGIGYSDSDLNNTWTKLTQTNTIAVTPESLENLLLADAVFKANKETVAAGASALNTQTKVQAINERFLNDIVGNYRREPFENGWHQGTIQKSADGGLTWTNQSNVSWPLVIDTQGQTTLLKCESSPYQDRKDGRAFVVIPDLNRGGIAGFRFLGETYKKL